jgi:hypothetical protein
MIEAPPGLASTPTQNYLPLPGRVDRPRLVAMVPDPWLREVAVARGRPSLSPRGRVVPSAILARTPCILHL